MKNLKHYSLRLFFCLMALSIAVASCKKKDGYNLPASDDMSKPDVVTNVKVQNFNGGANITYTLPNSENILYVLARYDINGKTVRETKSSFYRDTITVEGFAKAKDYDVTLYTVSRANVMSDPVTVKVQPLIPVYELVRKTVSLAADFSGVNIQALNALKKDVGLILLAFDSNTGKMEVQDQNFTKLDAINYAIRGYTNVARDFGIYVTDRWGNVSDTLKVKLTPLFEEMVDKSKFSVLNLPSDSQIGYGWVLTNLWNGKIDGDGWHTSNGTPAPYNGIPYVGSFGIGKTYKLSRFTLWQRTGSAYTYTNGNVKDFTIWGSNVNAPKGTTKLPANSAVGTVVDDWINLGNFHFPDPPSGLPPGNTNSADEAYVKAGVDFVVPFNAPAVKYIRVAMNSLWGNNTEGYIMEMSIYGTPQ